MKNALTFSYRTKAFNLSHPESHNAPQSKLESSSSGFLSPPLPGGYWLSPEPAPDPEPEPYPEG